MKKVILLSLLFMVQLSNGFACDCLWAGNFFQISEESDVIVKVKITGYEKIDQDFNEILICEVLKVYRGSSVEDTIKLRGDNGMFCAPYVSYFKIDQQYILQFDKKGENTPWLSNCGEYYLTINEGRVFSEEGIRKNLSQIGVMTISEFEKKLQIPDKNIPQLDVGFHPGTEKKNKPNEKNNGVNKLLILTIIPLIVTALILVLRRKQNRGKLHP